MTEPLRPGATIGILGGGQLGRMLSLAAARLGLATHIFDPDPTAPAGDVSRRLTRADYADKAALATFASAVDVVTFEFENIPLEALGVIEPLCAVHPGARALAISQDRLAEKQFLRSLGIPTAPFARFDAGDDPKEAATATGLPAIIKTRRMGYDGKGQIRVDNLAAVEAAMQTLAGTPAIIEGRVDFSLEASVIGARSLSGEVVCYDPGANVHRDGILHTTTVPAPLSLSRKTDAVLLAGRLMNALDYVGVLAVELFVTDGGLIVNEIAPRVHNSGHWTQNGCVTDQFEQHIRAIAGWPLGDGRRHSDVVMTNLIGRDVDDVPALGEAAQTGVHLYGKKDVRTGRKMGHVNKVTGAAS